MIYVCRSQLMRILRPDPLKNIYYLSETFRYPERNTSAEYFSKIMYALMLLVCMTLHV